MSSRDGYAKCVVSSKILLVNTIVSTNEKSKLLILSRMFDRSELVAKIQIEANLLA